MTTAKTKGAIGRLTAALQAYQHFLHEFTRETDNPTHAEINSAKAREARRTELAAYRQEVEDSEKAFDEAING